MIRFYFKRGRWHVTADKRAVPANDWWAAINEVKCMNHKLRMARHASKPGAEVPSPPAETRRVK